MYLDSNTKKLLEKYYKTMLDLQKAGVIRSSNNPVGDLGEFVASKVLRFELVDKSTKGYDGINSKKKRFEVKSRRITSGNKSYRLGAIRGLEKHFFDYLVVVIFNEDFTIRGLWQMPYSIVKKYSQFNAHQNAHILNFSCAILEEKRVIKIL